MWFQSGPRTGPRHTDDAAVPPRSAPDLDSDQDGAPASTTTATLSRQHLTEATIAASTASTVTSTADALSDASVTATLSLPPSDPPTDTPPPTRRYGRLPVPLIARILALVVLLGGVGAYLGGLSTVRIVDDGVARTFRTHADTVAGLLRHAGITLSRHDTIQPALTEPIEDGTQVTIGRARPLRLTLDGVTEQRWVTARTIAELLEQLGIGGVRVQLSGGEIDQEIPRTGMTLTIRTEKRLTLVADGNRSEITTFAATTAELLQEQGLELGEHDEVTPPVEESLYQVSTVTIVRVRLETRTETVVVEAPEEIRHNDEWMLDQRMVIEEGQDGESEQVIEYVYRDGELAERRVVSERVIREARPRIIQQGTQEYPPDPTGLNWEALAECESGGNPTAVSPGGTYHGLYQFSVETWRRVGGIGLPSQATPREQTYRAILLYQRAGAGQWPVCGSRLFT